MTGAFTFSNFDEEKGEALAAVFCLEFNLASVLAQEKDANAMGCQKEEVRQG